MRYTLEEVVRFCHTNRRCKGFRTFDWEQIAETVVWAADNGKLVYVADRAGIIGVAIFTVTEDVKRLYVHHIVAIRDGFRSLLMHARTHFTEYTFCGLRNGKLIEFNKKHLWAAIKA